MDDPRPGPEARVVGRGRISMVPVWLLIGLVGVSVLLLGGVALKLLIGAPFTLLALSGLVMLVRARVWVEGATLYSRTMFKHRPPIRLDELLSARLVSNSNWGRELHLQARDGTRLRLDATNLRLVRLYGAMAPFIGPYDRVANDTLLKRIERYRGSGLPG
jgi:hypothetical protein